MSKKGRSFENVNYATRPNKSLERRLIVELMLELRKRFAIEGYRYIGLGSLWFVDFYLMHKSLNITDMKSIEREQPIERFEFNKPFDCIEVVEGESSIVLPKLVTADKRCISWLDYDGGMDEPVYKDVSTFAEQAPSGSLLIVTMNAHHGVLNGFLDDKGETLTREQAFKESPWARFHDVKAGEASFKQFPIVVSKVFFSMVRHAVLKSGRKLSFRPLFNVFYNDGCPMVTVGGMLCDEADSAALDECEVFDKCDFAQQENQVELALPQLTFREKLAIERAIITSQAAGVDAPVPDLAFLDASNVKAYRKYYRFSPHFAEVSVM